MVLKKFAAVGIAGLLAFTVVGCSKKSSTNDTATADASQSEKQSDSNATVAKSTTTSGNSSDTSGSGVSGLNNLGDCLQTSLSYAALVLEPLGFMGGATQEQIDKFESDTADLKAKIPPEIQSEFQTVADAYRQYAETIKGVNFSDLLNPDTQKKLEDASKALDDPSVKAAQDKIDAYFKDTCGTGN